MRSFTFIFLIISFAILFSSCSATVLQSAPVPVTVDVSISPTALTLRTLDSISTVYGTEAQSATSGNTVQITGSTDSSLFLWSIDEGAAGGTLEPSPGSDTYFTYVAPNQPGIYHVRITDRIDPSQTTALEITVTN